MEARRDAAAGDSGGRRLADKAALVTGAGSGIGAAIARLFARHGARVAVADRDADAAQRTARAIADDDGRAVAITADISTGRGAEGCVDEAVGALGGLQILVNSAGVTPRYAPSDWDYERRWDWVMAVNLKGPLPGLPASRAGDDRRRRDRQSLLDLRAGRAADVSSAPATIPIRPASTVSSASPGTWRTRSAPAASV